MDSQRVDQAVQRFKKVRDLYSLFPFPESMRQESVRQEALKREAWLRWARVQLLDYLAKEQLSQIGDSFYLSELQKLCVHAVTLDNLFVRAWIKHDEDFSLPRERDEASFGVDMRFNSIGA